MTNLNIKRLNQISNINDMKLLIIDYEYHTNKYSTYNHSLMLINNTSGGHLPFQLSSLCCTVV